MVRHPHQEAALSGLAEIENRAGIARITCGWRKPHLPLDLVRRYWRDVHSPAIARRAGVYDYRHLQFQPVCPDLFAPVAGIATAAPPDAQLQWLSDVRYLDEAQLAVFATSPDGEARQQLLADIDMIVDQSTTYKATGDTISTLLDTTEAAPQGPSRHPRYAVFFRQTGDEPGFRACLRALAASIAAARGVLRLRLSLFDVPDMEAEKRAGYPIKTHPVERQYQAWMDLVVEQDADARPLLGTVPHLAEHVRDVHAYPVDVSYCSVYAGLPTLVGLRGYPAYDAITGLKAEHARGLALLRFMYGDHAQPGLASW